ncbi:MAG: very short patch repair endonuclease [Candidatus Wallbacteria bacterium]
MTDTVDKQTRSKIMQKVKSFDTSIEVKLRKELWKHEIKGWRKNYKKLIGKPDIVFTKYKIAIFINGCFWHGCPKCYRLPQTNKKYWINKVNKNTLRDKNNIKILMKIGWTVINFWEHEINNNILKCINKIKKNLKIKKGNPS